MDIDLLRTFLEVNRTRHFGRAADNLYLSQSAISARIRHLEEQVGAPLFTRDRNDIRLTAIGKRLLPHAESIVTAWHRARQEVALGEDIERSLSVGCSPSLRDILLQDWLDKAHQSMPEVAITANVAGSDELLRRLLDGTVDIALTFEGPQVIRLKVAELKSIPLVLVSTSKGISLEQATGEDYVLVDWGTSFLTTHANSYPNLPTPRLRFGLGRMAHEFILKNGGSAYLAEPMVKKHLEAGRLHRVAKAPVIERPAFVVYPGNSANAETIERALSLLAYSSSSKP
jgi:DNA-binding transcriptional LysR family regulator